MRLEESTNQKKFKNEYQKLALNLIYTHSWLTSIQMETLKPFNLSWQQFNILRILKDQHPKSATIKVLSENMIDRMSNASRLVEKLKQKGYVERKINKDDRRQVKIQITSLGLSTVKKASTVLDRTITKKMSTLPKNLAIKLNEYLDQLRG